MTTLRVVACFGSGIVPCATEGDRRWPIGALRVWRRGATGKPVRQAENANGRHLLH